jgi:hypothetical protein
MNWFYKDDNRKVGPVSETEIEELVRLGKISGQTSVWNEKVSKWTPYGELMSERVAEAPPLETPQTDFDTTQYEREESICIECGYIENRKRHIQRSYRIRRILGPVQGKVH